MKVIKIRFLPPSLVLAFLIIIVLSPVAHANPVPVWKSNLDWRLFPIVSLFNYAVNLGIVVAAFWLVKRKINIKLVKKLAITILWVTLVGICTILTILAGYLVNHSQAWPSFMFLLFFIPVSLVEVTLLALLLRWGKLSTLRQGILIGIAMIIVGFFVGFPITFSIL